MSYLSLLVYVLMIVVSCRAFRAGRNLGASTPVRRISLSRRFSSSGDDGLQFSFGVCADIQYVDADDDYNFQKTKLRRYRQSLEVFREAAANWRSSSRDIRFALLLGDILDGKCSALKSEKECLETVMSVCRENPFNFYPCLGNHDYYCFTRPELHARLFSTIPNTAHDKLYYDYSPHPSWRVLSLDAYDISLIGASSTEHLAQAHAILKAENPNDVAKSGTWFDGLPRDKFRYVPYNGGFGAQQLSWLRSTLQDAKQQGQRCIVFCHQPVFAPDKPQSVLWNAEEVLSIMRESQNVALWLAGHDHDGQYVVEDGIHHLVPPAPIECKPGETAFGTIHVFGDRLELAWVGREPSRATLAPWAGTRSMALSLSL